MQNKYPFLVFSLLCINFCYAQGIKGPETPTLKTFEPIKQSQGTLAGQQQNTIKTETKNEYRPLLQPQNPDNIYKNFNQGNYRLNAQSQVPNKSMGSVEMVKAVINEVSEREKLSDYHFQSQQNQKGAANFNTAFKEIADMLEGKTALDLKRAVFLAENAFFENQMKYEDFEKQIKNEVALIRLKMEQEHLSMKDNEAINFMVHQYMSDTLSIKVPSLEKTVTTFPMTYDFDDPFGKENPAKMFVTKLVAEHTGQCKSLPLNYLIFVFELGGNAYLSISPSHSYIKCKDNNAAWYNVELTNGRLSSDSWIMGSGFVKSEAVKGGIYLDTMNKKQIVANCLTDLGMYYSWRYGFDDFVLKCMNKSLQYNESNLMAILTKADYYSLLFKQVSEQKGYKNEADLKKDPAAYELFLQRNRLYALTDGLGYEPMPEDAYMDWLKTLDKKEQEQIEEQQYGKFRQIMR